MRCSRCGRVTLKPAAIIGKMVLGPTCARLAGLSERRIANAMKAKPPKYRKPDAGQIGLFDAEPVAVDETPRRGVDA